MRPSGPNDLVATAGSGLLTFILMRKKVTNFILHTIDLREGTDVRGTIDSIRNNIGIKGYNVWILAAAAVIASIGLDTNSQAVIIGAMLISPLMSPIL